jgi:hypothetical protein
VAIDLANRDVVRLTPDGAEESIENSAGLVCHGGKPTTDNRIVTNDVRYPDLLGKAAIVAGQGPEVIDVVAALAANRCLIAIVSADRELVVAATEAAEAHDVPVFGMTTDPADPATWERITQHIEQRLGPIDIAVAAGSTAVHEALRGALVHDMAARGHGVLIALGSASPADDLGGGVRHVVLRDDEAASVAAAASDTGQAG